MRPLTAGDAQDLVFPTGAGFVPGGRYGYYETARTAGDTEIRELWLFSRDGDEIRRIDGAFTNPRDAAPAPNGAVIAFVADVHGRPGICLTNIDTMTTSVIADPRWHGPGALSWSPSGDAIAFTAKPGPARDPGRPYRVDRVTLRYEGVGLVDDAVQEIYVFDLASGAVRAHTADRSVSEEPRWSPDGTRILFRQSLPPDREWRANPSVRVLDVASGDQRVVVDDWGAVFWAEWCPDGARVAFCGSETKGNNSDVYARKKDVWVVDVADGIQVCRTEILVCGIGDWLEYDSPTRPRYHLPRLFPSPSENAVYASAQEGGDVVIRRIALSGPERTDLLLGSPGTVRFLSDVDDTDGSLLYLTTTQLAPPDLYLRHAGAERRVTDLNGAVLRGVAAPVVHRFEVTAHDGLTLDAWALTPEGAGPFATVLCIHGGPNGAYGSVYMIDHHLLVGAGFAVVFSNFRGSGGYGDEFHAAMGGRWGPNGEPDHLATVDRAVELGIADGDRVGVFGLSHGGFATSWLAGRTDRFRAGVAENGPTNWLTLQASVDSPWWLPAILGFTPDRDPALAAELSPLTYAPRCTTPLLFVVGEKDVRCPPLEAEQYYQALKRTGCPTEMLRLPNADHFGTWFGPPAARRAQNEALVEWFGRYL